MADESTPSPVTETASPTAAAVTQPAVAETTVSTPAPTATLDNQATAEAAAEDEWFKSKQDDAAPVTEKGKTETPAAQGDNAPPPAQATTPEGLSAEELTTIKRYGMDPTRAAKALAVMDAEDRKGFLANLSDRARHHDALVNQVRQPAPQQNQQPPVQQGQPTGQQPAPVDSDPLKSLETEYGTEYVAPFRAAFQAQQAQFQQAMEPMQAQMRSFMAAQLEQQFEAGLAEATLPESVNLADPAVKDAIRKQAIALAQAEGFDPINNNLRHITPKAAASLFAKEILAAQSAQKQQQQAKNLRGSPTRTSALPKPRTETFKSEEEAENAYLAELKA